MGATHAKRPSKEAGAALVVMAKAPIEGQVKTRLCPPLEPDEAASLHGSLVMDMLECCRSVKGCDRILAGWPNGAHPFFKAMEARYKVKVWDQEGEDLGRRMAAVFQAGLGTTYHTMLLVGTDIPGMSAPLLAEGLKALAHHDVVLGPAQDGGYYLIGLRKPVPELFQDIPWSTDRVFSLTEDKARRLGLSVKVLARLRDLDTLDDLEAIIRDVKRPGATFASPRTKNVLLELEKRLNARARE